MFKKILLGLIICGLLINSVNAYTLHIDYDNDWAVSQLSIYDKANQKSIAYYENLPINKVNKLDFYNLTTEQIYIGSRSVQYIPPFLAWAENGDIDCKIEDISSNASYYCSVKTHYLRKPTFDFKYIGRV
ncbi:MAG: hypothetical protein LBR15_06175 [Methanobrevibacter sp.]|jgi:hypothetical protein|nr:hypothetical protein [Candidatus Methanovirga australis]